MVDQPGQESKIVVDSVRDSTMDLSEVWLSSYYNFDLFTCLVCLLATFSAICGLIAFLVTPTIEFKAALYVLFTDYIFWPGSYPKKAWWDGCLPSIKSVPSVFVCVCVR